MIELAEAMSISFDTWTNGSLSLSIDGIVLETSEPQPTLMGTARPWEIVRYGPVTLAAGKHTITTRLTAPEESPWLFGVLLVDDTGAPVVRCAQVAADREQDR
jgi:hypothetical protein